MERYVTFIVQIILPRSGYEIKRNGVYESDFQIYSIIDHQRRGRELIESQQCTGWAVFSTRIDELSGRLYAVRLLSKKSGALQGDCKGMNNCTKGSSQINVLAIYKCK